MSHPGRRRGQGGAGWADQDQSGGRMLACGGEGGSLGIGKMRFRMVFGREEVILSKIYRRCQ